MHPSPSSDTTRPWLPRFRWSTDLSSSLAFSASTGRVYYTIARTSRRAGLREVVVLRCEPEGLCASRKRCATRPMHRAVRVRYGMSLASLRLVLKLGPDTAKCPSSRCPSFTGLFAHPYPDGDAGWRTPGLRVTGLPR